MSSFLEAPELQSGPVLKKSRSGIRWVRRWLSVRGLRLTLSDADGSPAKKVFFLDDVTVQADPNRLLQFNLMSRHPPSGVLVFRCGTQEELSNWLSVLSARNPLPMEVKAESPISRTTPRSQPGWSKPALRPPSAFSPASPDGWVGEFRGFSGRGDAMGLARLQGRFSRRACAIVRALVEGRWGKNACLSSTDTEEHVSASAPKGGVYEGIRIRFANEESDFTHIATSIRGMQRIADDNSSDLQPLLAARVDFRGHRAFCLGVDSTEFCRPILNSELKSKVGDHKLAKIAQVLGLEEIAQNDVLFLSLPAVVGGGLEVGGVAVAAREWSDLGQREVNSRVPTMEGLEEFEVDERLRALLEKWEEHQNLGIGDSDSLRKVLASYGINCSLLGVIYRLSYQQPIRQIVACDAVARAVKRLLRQELRSTEYSENILCRIFNSALSINTSSIQNSYMRDTLGPLLRGAYSFEDLPPSADLPYSLLFGSLQHHCGVSLVSGLGQITPKMIRGFHARIKPVSFRECIDSKGLSDGSPLQDKLRLEWAAFSGLGALPPVPCEEGSCRWLEALQGTQTKSAVQWSLDCSGERVDQIAELMVKRGDAIPELLLLFSEAEIVSIPSQPRILTAGAFAVAVRQVCKGQHPTALEQGLINYWGCDNPLLLDGFRGIADAYWRLEQYRESLRYLVLCLDISSAALGQGHGVTGLYHSLVGHAYKKMGNLDTAIGHYDQARVNAKTRDDQDTAAEASLFIARCYRDKGDFAHAITESQMAAGSFRSKELLDDAMFLYAQCCEKMDRFSEASAAYDSLWSHNKSEPVRIAITRLALRRAFEMAPDVAIICLRYFAQLPGHTHEEKAAFALSSRMSDLESIQELHLAGTSPKDIVNYSIEQVHNSSRIDPDQARHDVNILVSLYAYANPDSSLISKSIIKYPASQLEHNAGMVSGPPQFFQAQGNLQHFARDHFACAQSIENQSSKNTTIADLRKYNSGSQMPLFSAIVWSEK